MISVGIHHSLNSKVDNSIRKKRKKFMIVGLTGSPFSGKATLADYLVENFNYTKVSLNALPAELQDANESLGPVGSEENKEAASSEETFLLCSVERITKVLKRMLEVDWRRNWVVYPLPRTKEM